MNELRPSRDLLDPNFGGYKLSLTSVPVHQIHLPESVDVVEPSEDQYSFLHQREFSLYNHLHSDSWQPLNVYFIDKLWNVKKININDLTGRPDGINSVFQIPRDQERSGGEFNVSLLFPTENLVVIGDGFKSLHIVKAPNRSEYSSQWELSFSKIIFDDPRPFHIVDATCSSDGSRLHCILLHVEPKDDEEFEADKKENKNTSKYKTVLQWITFKIGDNQGNWSMERNEDLRGSGKVEYVAIENDGNAIYLASQNKFKFPKFEHSSNDVNVLQQNGDKEDYMWQQSFDNITLYFDGVSSTEGVSVNVNEKTVIVKHNEDVLLTGTLTHNVSSELTTWTLNDSRLEVVLQKSESGAMWQKLMMDPSSRDEKIFIGKELIDPATAQDINNRLSHLTSETVENGSGIINDWEMEECDAFEEESTTLYRFVPDQPDPTHKVLIGGSKWLFTVKTSGDSPQSMCIRSDVDGCVWKPSPPNETSWPINHIGTFFAFGYILASKVNRKFTVSPQDLSYVSVIDNTGHVIIYRKGVAVGGELRNRKTNQTVESIATQSMVNLQTKENILGAVATTSYLFILTTSNLHLVHIV